MKPLKRLTQYDHKYGNDFPYDLTYPYLYVAGSRNHQKFFRYYVEGLVASYQYLE